ncbi:MAG: DNA helicase RecQ, partial [Nitrospirales bacterium]
FDGTEIAETLLSCIETIYDTSGFSVGLNHVIAVLTGANTEKIRRWHHNQLPMYGQGKTHSRPAWAAMARELIRLGYLRQATEAFSVLEITEQGQAFTQDRHTIMLTTPISEPLRKTHSTDEVAHDESLFEHLRQLRKSLADERDVPAYVIFSDVALRQMAQDYPANEQEFLRISGVGKRKMKEFGADFLAAIAEYVGNNPRQHSSNTSTAPPRSASTLGKAKPLSNTIQETLRVFQRGFSVEDIAKQRGLVASTIYGHLEQAIQAGESVDINRLITAEEQTHMAAAFAQTGLGNLTGAKELLGDLYDYGQLRVFRAIHGERGQ